MYKSHSQRYDQVFLMKVIKILYFTSYLLPSFPFHSNHVLSGSVNYQITLYYLELISRKQIEGLLLWLV